MNMSHTLQEPSPFLYLEDNQGASSNWIEKAKECKKGSQASYPLCQGRNLQVDPEVSMATSKQEDSKRR